jgi:hypothetical protein
MKKLLFVLLANLFCLSFLFAGDGKEKWQTFSDNLTQSLKSENPGVRYSAMQLIIEYSDKVDVQDGVYDVMREFRNSDDLKVRKLTLITLYKMNNNWAIDFLKRQYKFEDNKEIKNTISSIVSAYNNQNEYIVSKDLMKTFATINY